MVPDGTKQLSINFSMHLLSNFLIRGLDHKKYLNSLDLKYAMVVLINKDILQGFENILKVIRYEKIK